MYENFSPIRRLSELGTRLFIALFAKPYGEDSFGTRYYEEKNPPKGRKAKRWALYRGEPEPSKIPPDWFGWLHYQMEAPLSPEDPFHHAWQKPHEANLSGTPDATRPHSPLPDSTLSGEVAPSYKAWKP